MVHGPSLSTDKALRAAVLEAFAANEEISAGELRVGVRNGIVHLGGSAATLAAWEQAAKVAAEVPGVRGVANRISAPGAPTPSRNINLNLSEQG